MDHWSNVNIMSLIHRECFSRFNTSALVLMRSSEPKNKERPIIEASNGYSIGAAIEGPSDFKRVEPW